MICKSIGVGASSTIGLASSPGPFRGRRHESAYNKLLSDHYILLYYNDNIITYFCALGSVSPLYI